MENDELHHHRLSMPIGVTNPITRCPRCEGFAVSVRSSLHSPGHSISGRRETVADFVRSGVFGPTMISARPAVRQMRIDYLHYHMPREFFDDNRRRIGSAVRSSEYKESVMEDDLVVAKDQTPPSRNHRAGQAWLPRIRSVFNSSWAPILSKSMVGFPRIDLPSVRGPGGRQKRRALTASRESRW